MAEPNSSVELVTGELEDAISESTELADGTFAEAVLAVVNEVPAGQVTTYGDVAALLGSRGARVVGRVMARYGSGTAWWRVVRADGLPPIGHAEQAHDKYQLEGTPLIETGSGAADYRIDIARCRWPS